MAKVNIDISGISELKWTKMGDLLQVTTISTTVGKNPLEEMGSPKSPNCSIWEHLKND